MYPAPRPLIMPSAPRYAEPPDPLLPDSSPGSLRDAVYRPTREERAAEKERHRKELSEQRAAARTISRLEEQLASEEIDLAEMSEQLELCCPTSYRQGEMPEPTSAEPGSAEKIRVLRDRVARGERTDNPDDAYLVPTQTWYCPGTPRPVQERSADTSEED